MGRKSTLIDTGWLQSSTLPVALNNSTIEGFSQKLHREFSPESFVWWSTLSPDQKFGPLPYDCFLLSNDLYLVLFQKGTENGNECVATFYDYAKKAVLITSYSFSDQGKFVTYRVNKGSLNAPLTYDTLVAHTSHDLIGTFHLSSPKNDVPVQRWSFGSGGKCTVSALQQKRQYSTRAYSLNPRITVVCWRSKVSRAAGLLLMNREAGQSICMTVPPTAPKWRFGSPLNMSD